MTHVSSIRLNILLVVLLLLSMLEIFHLKSTIDDQQEVLRTLVKSEISLSQQLDEAVTDTNNCIKSSVRDTR
jgi:t-SNARE complex subunit (syntaxin)